MLLVHVLCVVNGGRLVFFEGFIYVCGYGLMLLIKSFGVNSLHFSVTPGINVGKHRVLVYKKCI